MLHSDPGFLFSGIPVGGRVRLSWCVFFVVGLLVVAAEFQAGPLDGPGSSLATKSVSWALNFC